MGLNGIFFDSGILCICPSSGRLGSLCWGAPQILYRGEDTLAFDRIGVCCDKVGNDEEKNKGGSLLTSTKRPKGHFRTQRTGWCVTRRGWIAKNWRGEGREEDEGYYRHGESIGKMGGMWEIDRAIYDGIIIRFGGLGLQDLKSCVFTSIRSLRCSWSEAR